MTGGGGAEGTDGKEGTGGEEGTGGGGPGLIEERKTGAGGAEGTGGEVGTSRGGETGGGGGREYPGREGTNFAPGLLLALTVHFR